MKWLAYDRDPRRNAKSCFNRIHKYTLSKKNKGGKQYALVGQTEFDSDKDCIGKKKTFLLLPSKRILTISL